MTTFLEKGYTRTRARVAGIKAYFRHFYLFSSTYARDTPRVCEYSFWKTGHESLKRSEGVIPKMPGIFIPLDGSGILKVDLNHGR